MFCIYTFLEIFLPSLHTSLIDYTNYHGRWTELSKNIYCIGIMCDETFKKNKYV